jgi:hypothetical protein
MLTAPTRNAIQLGSTPHGTRAESWSALFTVQMQKQCGSAALSKRLEMQEHRRAACRLQSPVAADLPGDGELLDPAALRTATQRWCDIAERELHLATAQFSWSRTAATREQRLVDLVPKVAEQLALVSTKVVCFMFLLGSDRVLSCRVATSCRQGCLTILLMAGRLYSVPA